MRRIAIVVVLTVAACGSDDGDSAPATTESIEDFEEGLAGAPDCAELVGLPTQQIADAGGCVQDDGELLILGFASYDCTDGRTLLWNDEGWGYDDGDWQAHERTDGQLVPPDAEMGACLG